MPVDDAGPQTEQILGKKQHLMPAGFCACKRGLVVLYCLTQLFSRCYRVMCYGKFCSSFVHLSKLRVTILFEFNSSSVLCAAVCKPANDEKNKQKIGDLCYNSKFHQLLSELVIGSTTVQYHHCVLCHVYKSHRL